MSYTTEDIESAVRQAFRAGWWRRGKEPLFESSVERRNQLEDADVPPIMARFEAPAETGGGDVSNKPRRQKPVPVTGIMLRGEGQDLIVEAEVDGRWVVVIREGTTCDGPAHTVSHIVEPLGIRRAISELPGDDDGES